MRLIPISEHPDHAKILYDLLAEREPSQSISHKRMPTWEEHLEFIASVPYEAWHLIQVDDAFADDVVGAVYLSKANEVGIFLFGNEQGFGIAPMAVQMLMEKHGPRKYLANINPANEASRKMFEKLGFRLVQHTYALEPK